MQLKFINLVLRAAMSYSTNKVGFTWLVIYFIIINLLIKLFIIYFNHIFISSEAR